MAKNILSFIFEFVIWFGSIFAFFEIYSRHHFHSTFAVWYHLIIVVSVLILIIFLRICLCCLLSADRWIRWFGSAVGAIFLIGLLSYYSLVIAGLKSWGQIVSWPLISTYAAQWQELAHSQGFSTGFVVACVMSVLGLLTAVIALGPGRWDWVPPLSQFIRSSRPGKLILFGCLAIAVANVLSFAISPLQGVSAGEPLSLTFFPDWQRGRTVQDYRLTGSAVLDDAVDQAIDRYVPSVTARRRNIIVIVGDALRADRLQNFGYTRPTTPFLAQLASQNRSSQVKQSWSVCAQSTCGLMAFAGSRYVHQMSDRSFTLIDVLKLHGYESHMILGGDHTNFYGLRDAYGEVDHYFDGSMASGFYMNDDRLVVERMASMANWNGQPVYMQFHLMASHPLGARVLPPSFLPSESYVLEIHRRTASKPTDAMINFYDNGVRQFDDTVRQLLILLEAKGYLKDSIVVITGDHGEMLGEKGVFGHSKGVYEPVLRIPMIFVRYGNGVEKTILTDRPASQVDIAPTLLADLEMPIPEVWVGHSLLSDSAPDFIYFQQSPIAGLIDMRTPGRPMKYWIDTQGNTAQRL